MSVLQGFANGKGGLSFRGHLMDMVMGDIIGGLGGAVGIDKLDTGVVSEPLPYQGNSQGFTGGYHPSQPVQAVIGFMGCCFKKCGHQ